MDKEGAMIERYEGLPATKGGAPAFAFKVSRVKEGTLLAVAVVTVVSGYLLGGRFMKRDCAPCDRMTITGSIGERSGGTTGCSGL